MAESFITDSLAQFCIAQRDAFNRDDWYARFNVDRKAVALAARYLSMTSWYGHEEELEQIAVATDAFDNSYGLHRESQAIGFDLPHFSYTVRSGIAQAHIRQQTVPSAATRAGASQSRSASVSMPLATTPGPST
jgi:hypothetical protein